MAVLDLLDIHKSYRSHLSIGEGEVFGFIGTNGAGKTTTIKLALGLIFSDQGSVRLFGEDASRVELRRRVGFLPENPYLYDYLTGEEFLDFHARLFGLDRITRRKRVKDLLERVGLGNRGYRQLRHYSKGMLQRIGLAQALINDPDLVVLDEPMSGLDPIGRREVRDIILDLKTRGRTVFFSTHILSDTHLPCGRIVSRREDRVLVRVDTQGDLHRLLSILNGHGARLVSVTPARQSLEDLFIREARAASAPTARLEEGHARQS